MNFKPLIEKELRESAIAASVAAVATEIVPDVEIDEITHDVTGTPIDDILGRKYTRFGFKAKANRAALGFKNEDGTFWQLKIFGESVRGRSGQYYAPKNIGDVPYLPAIPREIVEAIAAEHGLEPPTETESFWEWFKQHKEIPLITTEGGKKQNSITSQGFVSTSLFGCTCGVNRDGSVKESLRPYVEGRKVTIAFDEDVKAKAAKAVKKGTARLARAIERAGGTALVAHWDKDLGKGIDDLIAYDAAEFHKAIAGALPFDVWEFEQRRKLNPHRLICSRWFPSDLDIPENVQLIFAKSAKGTGKTTWLIQQVHKLTSEGKRVYVITHRISLAKALCRLFGLDHIDNLGTSEQRGVFGYGLCIDSLHPDGKSKFNSDDLTGASIVIDEIDQVLWHGLNSETCQRKRTKILSTLEMSIQTAIATGGKIFASSADVRPIDVKYIQDLAGGTNPQTFIIENTFVPVKGDLTSYATPQDVIALGLEEIARGGVPIFHLSAQKEKSKYSTINIESLILEQFPDKKVLRIDSETVADKFHPAYQCGEDDGGGDRPLDRLIEQYDVIVASPTIETGVSIETSHITGVFAIANGVSSVDGACQALERVRTNVPRHVYFIEKAKSFSYIGNGATYAAELLRSEQAKFQLNLGSLAAVDYSTDARTHTEAWATMAAEQNLGFRNYRAVCLNKQRNEGYQVIERTETTPAGEALGELLKGIKDKNYLAHCEKIEREPNPSDSLMLSLKHKLRLTKDEAIAYRKGSLCRRYLTEDIDIDLIRDDDDGLYQKLLNNYLLFDGAEHLDKYNQSRLDGITGEGVALQYDINRASLLGRIKALKTILSPLFKLTQGRDRIKGEDLRGWFESLLERRKDIKDFTGSWVSPKDSPITVAQRFLSMAGMVMPQVGRSNNVRCYAAPVFDFSRYQDILNRWQERDRADATPPIYISTSEGVALVQTIQTESPELPEGLDFGIIEAIENAIEQLQQGTKTAIAKIAETLSTQIISTGAEFLSKITGVDYMTPLIELWIFA